MTKQSKSQLALSVIQANTDKSYQEVSNIIAQALGITEYLARGYYQRAVKSGAVSGIENTFGRGKRTNSDAKPKVAKVKPVVTPVELTKEVEALRAEIKAKNLETLRQVSAKRKMTRVVNVPEDTVDTKTETEWEAATAVSSDEIKNYIHSSLHEKLGLR
jgi:hypothetical protein